MKKLINIIAFAVAIIIVLAMYSCTAAETMSCSVAELETTTEAEAVADNCYFGDSKKDGDNGGSYGNSNGSYSSPPPAHASDFSQMEDDDAQLPF